MEEIEKGQLLKGDILQNPLWNYSPKPLDKRPTWWGDVGDNLNLIYKPISNRLNNFYFPPDPSFMPTIEQTNMYPREFANDLLDTKSQAEFDNMVNMYNEMSEIRERLSINNSISAMLMAGILDPINLVPIPTVAGIGFIRAFKRGAVSVAGLTGVQEAWRADRDPTHTAQEAMFNITGSAFFGGLLSGTIGHLTRGMNVGKIGAEYTIATNQDDPNINTTSTMKTKTIDGKKELVEEIEFRKEEVKKSTKKDKDITKEDAKIKGITDESGMTAKAFLYEKVVKFTTVFGDMVNRFKSPESSRLATLLIGDSGTISNANKAGEVYLGGDHSVFMSEGIWRGKQIDYVKFADDQYANYLAREDDQIIDDKPARIGEMPVARMYRQTANVFNKDKKMSAEDFYREVTKAISEASIKQRTIKNKTVKFGEIKHEIPEVEATAKRQVELMEETARAGEETGLLKTEKHLEEAFNSDMEELIKWQTRHDTTSNIKNPTLQDKVLKLLEEKFIAQILNELEVKEFWFMKHIDAQQRASNKMEEILETIEKKKIKLNDKYNTIIDEELIRKANKVKRISEIENHIKESIEDMKSVLAQLDADYHNPQRGLTKNQERYRKILIRRITEIYGLKSVDEPLGPIPTKAGTPKQQELLKKLIKELNTPRTARKEDYMKKLLHQIKQPASKAQTRYLTNLQKTITDTHFSEKQLMPPNEAHYLMRIWNEGAIKDNYDVFINKVVIPYLIKKPYGKLRTTLEETLPSNASSERVQALENKKRAALENKAREITNNIIHDTTNGNYDNVSGRGFAKFTRSRNLDMPNYMLLKEHNGIADFIAVDSRVITNNYMSRFAPLVEMARKFPQDILAERQIRNVMYTVALREKDKINKKGVTNFLKELSNHEDDFRTMTDILLKRLHNPNGGSYSNQIIKALMQFSQLSMMGKATIASLADPAKIILARGFKETFGLYFKDWGLSLKERDLKKMALEDLQVTSEGAGSILNSTPMRHMMNDLNDYGQNRKFGRLGDKGFNLLDEASAGFWNMNFLNLWTDKVKSWVGLMSSDRIIRSGYKLANKIDNNNKNFKDDIAILGQYGLTKDDLIEIYKQWKKAGGEKNAKGRHIYYSNVQKWDTENQDIVRKYILAVRTEQLNTIVTPTLADKPYLAFGLIGRKAQRRQHNFYKIPLQFMAWAFGANNKILMSSLQGRHKGQLSGMLAMVSLGFMSDFLRNPSYWERKPLEEKIIKGVEYSGLTSWWLDINNALEIMSDNTFGIRPTFGDGNPFAGDMADIFAEPFGPVGSQVVDVAKLLTDSNLSSTRKASMLRRLLPYNNLFYADWLFKGAQRQIMQ